MTLTRHTQVENLANQLSSQRAHNRSTDARTNAYLSLIACVLERPVEDIVAQVDRRPPAPISRVVDHSRAA